MLSKISPTQAQVELRHQTYKIGRSDRNRTESRHDKKVPKWVVSFSEVSGDDVISNITCTGSAVGNLYFLPAPNIQPHITK